MLKRFYKHELNSLNTVVKTATDALMLMYQKPGNVLKSFTEHNPQTTIPPARYYEVFITLNCR